MISVQRCATILISIFLCACAGATPQQSSPDLLNTEWLLEDLAGKGVLDRIQSTLSFPAPNKVAGRGSCNRFSGAVEINGEHIKFGNLASTRMACLGDAAANQEYNYLQALQDAERISINGPYLLLYSKGRDKPLRFTRLTTH